MVTDIDATSYNGDIHPWVDCRGTLKKLDKPSSRYRVDYLRSGSFSIFFWLVGPPEGKEQEENLRASESHGRFL